MAQIPLPKPIELQQILSMMYGSGLKAEPGDPVPADRGSKSLVAIYVDDDNQPIAACTVDYPFTAYAGASLTRIPKGTAEECAGTGEFTEIMLGNVHEIMNICSRLLMDNSSPHLRLQTLYDTPDKLPEEVLSLVRDAADKVGFNVAFPDYGDGRISLRALAA